MKRRMVLVFLLCLVGSSAAQRYEGDSCPLRSASPISKIDVEDAHTLLSALSTAQESLRTLRESPGSRNVSVRDDSYCCGPSSIYIALGTLADSREMLIAFLKDRITKTTCRLRAIGIDMPKP